MQAHQTHRPSATPSPKDVLRAHVDQLSPAQQREFIAVALGLIADRKMLDEIEATVQRMQPPSAPASSTVH